MWTEMILS